MGPPSFRCALFQRCDNSASKEDDFAVKILSSYFCFISVVSMMSDCDVPYFMIRVRG